MAEGTSRSRPPPSNGGRGRRRRAAKGVLPSARLRGSPWTGLPRSKPSSGARHPCRSSWKAARATRDYIRHGINTVSPRRGSPPATSPLATDRGAGPGVPATGRPGLPSQELHLAVDNYAVHKVPPILARLEKLALQVGLHAELGFVVAPAGGVFRSTQCQALHRADLAPGPG